MFLPPKTITYKHQYYILASHTAYAVYANFIRKGRDLQFNVDFERQIVEQLFHGRFTLLPEILSEIY